MTDKQKQEYLRLGGCKCPYCESDNLHTGEMQFEHSGAYVGVVCRTCCKEWTDHYGLTDVEPEEL